MGCDIHLHLECNIIPVLTPDGKPDDFILKASPLIWRHYALFGYMAGVRGGTAIVEPRGLPIDVSTDVHAEYKDWEADAHHTSWLTLSELKQVASVCENDDLQAIIAMMQVYDDYHWHPRVVFWFDN